MRSALEPAGGGSAPPGVPLGTASWLDLEEARARLGFADTLGTGQVWLGELPDAEAEPVGYKDDRHICLVSGARGGKGTTVLIPNLLIWPGSCVVVDPKGENATVTARRRGAGSDYARGLGQKVHILDPFGAVKLDASLKSRFNPLDALDPSGEETVDEVARIAETLVVTQNSNDPFWEESARALLKGLILYVLTERDFEGMRNLVTVRRLLNQGDWITVDLLRQSGETEIPSAHGLLWEGMARNQAFAGVVAGVGEQFRSMSDKTRSSVLRVALNNTEFLDSPAMQRMLEASDFEIAALKTDPKGVSLYLSLPQRYMNTHYRWLRMMIALLVTEMEKVPGRPATGHPILFMLDEFAGLKRMEVIENAAAQIAGFGVKLLFVVQTLVQLKEIYKDAWETFLGNAGTKIFFDIEDDFTRSYLSRQLGEREITRQTQSGNRSHSTSSSTTTGTSDSATEGRSRSATQGRSQSTSEGQSTSDTRGRSEGTSSGDSFSEGRSGGTDFFLFQRFQGHGRHWSRQKGSNFSQSSTDSVSHSDSRNVSSSASESSSVSDGESASTSTSRSQSSSESETLGSTSGWSEGIHKRLLMTPDEIGRFLARVDDRASPTYPGMMVVLMPGQFPAELRRVRYFDSAWFERCFDPHPDHPPPPTLAEWARRDAEKEAARLAAEAARRAAQHRIEIRTKAPDAPAPREKSRWRPWYWFAAMVAAVTAVQYLGTRDQAPGTPPPTTQADELARLQAQIAATNREIGIETAPAAPKDGWDDLAEKMRAGFAEPRILALGVSVWSAPGGAGQANGTLPRDTLVEPGRRERDANGWEWIWLRGRDGEGRQVSGYVRADLVSSTKIAAQPGGRCAKAYRSELYGDTRAYRPEITQIMTTLPDAPRPELLAFTIPPNTTFAINRSVRGANGWEWHVIPVQEGGEAVVRADHLRPAPVVTATGNSFTCR
ncbi:MAG: type IV secretory system conjugative DNA transfer family protein [Geminicoccaceae bacterium]